MSSVLASPAGRWLLLGSLALNLALLLALGLPHLGLGQASREAAAERSSRAGPVPWVIRGVFEGDRREQVNAIMQAHRDPIRRVLRDVRQARRDVGGALRADPFDAPELERRLDGLRRAEAEASIAMHRMLADVAADLDSAERIAVAARLWSSERRERTGQGRSDWRERREREEKAEREQERGDAAEADPAG